MSKKPEKGNGELLTTIRDLAARLGVKVAFVCEVIGARREEARTLALSVDGEFLDQLQYKLEGTPCALVCEKGVAFTASKVADMYPEDTLLADWKIDSYMGVAFYDSGGDLMGHVGVMHDEGLSDPSSVETELRGMALELGPRLEAQRSA